MNRKKIKKLFSGFLRDYNVEEHKLVWEKQSKEFRNFWQNKILNKNYSIIPKKDLDPIIRILDYLARGGGKFRKAGGEAVAKLGWISQKKYYRLFQDLKEKRNIAKILDNIFKAKSEKDKINLINKLEEVNRNNIGWLTTPKALVLNDFLFAYNSSQYISVVSLGHRFQIIDYFGIGNSKFYQSISYGEKIIKTNKDIISGFKKKYDIDTIPRSLTEFFYSDGVNLLWRVSH